MAPRREAILLRRAWDLPGKPVRALARVTGRGFVDFTVNGRKPDPRRVIAPALSDLTRRTYYDTYDITPLLTSGTNVFGAVLGNGFFSTPGRGWNAWYGVGNEPVLSLEVEVLLADGSRRVLTTDPFWVWSTGEITFNDFFVGEHQDLRLAKPGWDQPGFPATDWQPAIAVAAPPGRIEANPGVPVRVFEEVIPVRSEGSVFVFASMYTGWPCVRVRGRAGLEVRISDHRKHAGKENGSSVEFRFLLRGDGVETLEPRFMVHSIGSQVAVTGLEPTAIQSVTIKRAGADLRTTGTFACSNDFLNGVHAATERTHRNYVLDIPMDPTREKAGWIQDVQTMIDSTVYLTDMAALYRRWWVDLADSCTPDGRAGSVVPMIWGGQEHCWDDPWWSGMVVYLPFKHYQYYGDRLLLAQAYPSMKRYTDWLTTRADPKDGLLKWSGASDWIEVGINGWGPPKRTSRFLVSTCAWYLYATLVSRSAAILGKDEDVATYAGVAQRIRDNVNARCYDPATGLYAQATDSQTALILPLCLGLVPDDQRARVIAALEQNIRVTRQGHHSTGFVGTPYLMEGLADLGLAETSYTMVTQQTPPSWKSLISDGVMKETWEGGLAQMPSLGGSIGQWFYRTIGGLRPDSPGFRTILIKPSPMGDLTWATCRYESPSGTIISDWKRQGGTFTLAITVPANTTATVVVPSRADTEVREGAVLAAEAPGVRFLRREGQTALFEVGSGTYTWTSQCP